MQVSTLS